MMGQDDGVEADQRIKEAGKQEEMVGAGNSMLSVVTGRRKGDNEQAEEYWDPKTAAFSSPFYDPFCEGGEEEVNNIAHLPLPAAVATIQAYHSNGAHRT
ncbi:unnamed protein product [Amaranthus hypochondriacus]